VQNIHSSLAAEVVPVEVIAKSSDEDVIGNANVVVDV